MSDFHMASWIISFKTGEWPVTCEQKAFYRKWSCLRCQPNISELRCKLWWEISDGLLTALIRLCHTSVKSGEEVLTRLAFWVQAGHDHSGMDSIAMDGASNVNVPPWRMGSLEIKRSNGKQLRARSQTDMMSGWEHLQYIQVSLCQMSCKIAWVTGGLTTSALEKSNKKVAFAAQSPPQESVGIYSPCLFLSHMIKWLI